MSEKIKISAVSYLNTKPYLKGFELSENKDLFDIQLDYPADSAKKLIDGLVDIALVPVVVLPKLKTPQIISNFGIGALGSVKTVCVFSNCPIEEIETIYLDYQSKTSVQLIQILTKNYWKINPNFVASEIGFEDKIKGNTAALIIGDRTIPIFNLYSYIYDLSEAWYNYCGLGFVFAQWIANKPLSGEILKTLESVFQNSMEVIDDVIIENKHLNNDFFSVEKYLKENIHYTIICNTF
ncbi:MAG: menaquinone biosynthesis protein [Bacteroidetes bacterium]|nr:menaquinone biosynthesis protein [Bacteroidota bacterium]